MPSYDYDIAIIGGGAAGLTVAAGAAQLGASTLLIEQEPMLGGDCLHYGCVPSKTLIKSAHVYHLMQRAADFGLPTPPSQPVDFSKVSTRIKEVIATIQVHDSVERFCKLGVKVEFGTARFIDQHSVELNGQTVSAKHWVIATGSSPSAPSFPGLEQTPYITNKEIFYLDELPPSLLVLGAGPIACEMAQAFARLGSKVTVIQRSAQILSKEDKDMADVVQQAMAEEGITFHLGASIEQVSDSAEGRQVTFRCGAGPSQTVSGHTLLVALGRTANSEGLNLEGLDIAMERGAIKVDQRLRTNHSHIYAPGDVNGRYQFTHAAGYEGGIVVSNAIFHLPRKADYSWLPWATYTDPELASIGMNEKAAKAAGLDYQVWSESFSNNDRAQAENETQGKIKMILDAKEKPLGVQITGPRAGDLIGEWVTLLNGKVKLSTLAGAIHPYPTLTEINKRVAGNFFSPKIFSPMVKKGLKLVFGLKGGGGNPCSTLGSRSKVQGSREEN